MNNVDDDEFFLNMKPRKTTTTELYKCLEKKKKTRVYNIIIARVLYCMYM